MADWLFEDGIGERRAILVDAEQLVEIVIERDGDGIPVGSVIDARLSTIIVPGRRGIVTFDDASEALVEPLDRHWTHGSTVRVVVVRQAMPERDAVKRAKVRPAIDRDLTTGPTLIQRLRDSGLPVIGCSPPGLDRFEAAGWSEALEAAYTGRFAFDGGVLRLYATPAMTLIDIDGWSDPFALALAAASTAAATLRRCGIGGSIGMDFPTLGSRTERLAAAARFDATLPLPFERTAINGFGFLQIIRPRERLSVVDRLQGDPLGSAAIALLRRAERSQLIGPTRLVGPAGVIDRLAAQPAWLERLGRQLGGAVGLRIDVTRAISASDVERA